MGGLLVLLLSFPFLAKSILSLAHGEFWDFLFSGAGFGLLIVAGLLVRRGVHYEVEQKKRKWTRSTRVPWKSLAATCAAAATGIVAFFVVGHSVIISACFAVGSALGMLLTYGRDPQYANKDAVSRFGVTADDVVDMLEEADKKISSIEAASKDIGNLELRQRLGRITSKARDILGVIEEDPRDLRRARKFLRTYLNGAKSVTEGYAKTHKHQHNEELETNFRNVLETIEQTCNEQYQNLLENDVWDLDVQIEVLEAQLKREGVV